jgi:tRNA1(Val) A37 N6-methylase TrmN6
VKTTEGTLLDGKIRYRQFAAGHRSGFEPVLLAAAVPAKPGESVLEAGTGAGAALLCLAHRVPGLTGLGLEIDPVLTDLATENFKINGLETFSAITADAAHPPDQKFDHILANPPWHGAASTNSPDAIRALAHHAPPGLLSEWLAALTKALKPEGSITLILPAAALSEAATALRAARHGALALFPLWPRAGRPANQIIIAGRKGSKTQDKILPGLFLHGEQGLTPAAEAVLRHGAGLAF